MKETLHYSNKSEAFQFPDLLHWPEMNLTRCIPLQQEVRLFLALQTRQPFLEGKPAIKLFYDVLIGYDILEKFA